MIGDPETCQRLALVRGALPPGVFLGPQAAQGRS
jgi:hypothetical protein